ncbi:unnamed protein product [Penicillium manginii]
MWSIGNVVELLCLLLALSEIGFCRPTVLNITSEEFAQMSEHHMSPGNNRRGFFDRVGDRVGDTWCGIKSGVDLCDTSRKYEKIGDGDPHQNFVIIQRAGSKVHCTSDGDSTGTTFSSTVGWSIDGSFDSIPFASAGFSISESSTFAFTATMTCDSIADKHGDICLLFYHAMTAFSVKVTEYKDCGCGVEDGSEKDLGETIVYAPNEGDAGSIASKGISVDDDDIHQCSGNDDRIVDYHCGPPGDSSWWDDKSSGPWIEEYVKERVPAGCNIPIEANQYYK